MNTSNSIHATRTFDDLPTEVIHHIAEQNLASAISLAYTCKKNLQNSPLYSLLVNFSNGHHEAIEFLEKAKRAERTNAQILSLTKILSRPIEVDEYEKIICTFAFFTHREFAASSPALIKILIEPRCLIQLFLLKKSLINLDSPHQTYIDRTLDSEFDWKNKFFIDTEPLEAVIFYLYQKNFLVTKSTDMKKTLLTLFDSQLIDAVECIKSGAKNLERARDKMAIYRRMKSFMLAEDSGDIKDGQFAHLINYGNNENFFVSDAMPRKWCAIV